PDHQETPGLNLAAGPGLSETGTSACGRPASLFFFHSATESWFEVTHCSTFDNLSNRCFTSDQNSSHPAFSALGSFAKLAGIRTELNAFSCNQRLSQRWASSR